jgi:hypothetical protein
VGRNRVFGFWFVLDLCAIGYHSNKDPMCMHVLLFLVFLWLSFTLMSSVLLIGFASTTPSIWFSYFLVFLTSSTLALLCLLFFLSFFLSLSFFAFKTSIFATLSHFLLTLSLSLLFFSFAEQRKVFQSDAFPSPSSVACFLSSLATSCAVKK